MNPADLKNYELAERKHVKWKIGWALISVWIGVWLLAVGWVVGISAVQRADVIGWLVGFMLWLPGLFGFALFVTNTRTEYVLVKKDDSK